MPDPLLDAVVDLLAGGPLAGADLIARLRPTGLLDDLIEVVDGDYLVDELADQLGPDAVWLTADGTFLLTEPLVSNIVLSHRLTEAERRSGAVRRIPDLGTLDWNADGAGLLLPDGWRLEFDLGDWTPDDDASSLIGPDGWLDGTRTGDLLIFARDGQSVSVTPAGDVGDDHAARAALTQAITARVLPGDGVEADTLVMDALAIDRESFRRPVRPVSELLVACGLERRGIWFGRAGERWRSPAELARRALTIEKWDLEQCCEEAFDLAADAFTNFQITGEVEPRAVAHALAHGAAAAALADHLLPPAADGHPELVRFALAVVAGATPKAAVGARLLLGVEADRRGDVLTAESHVETALRDDAGFGAAAQMLARYKVDRGDFRRAIALLHHPDLEPDPSKLEMLEEYAAIAEAPYVGVGRNDSCPCGSGRKFKMCCQRDPKSPVSLGALAFKLVQFAARADRLAELRAVASEACDPDDPDYVEALAAKIHDPVIIDFVSWEGNGAATYLHQRGPLLPIAERTVLAALIDEPRRLWEIVAVETGRSLSLRDTKTGESIVVNERLGSRDRQPGELFFARVARLEDGNQLVGVPFVVPLRLRDSAIELVDSDPDAFDLAAWWGYAFAPPRLANREGEPFRVCRAELVLAAPPGDALDSVYKRTGDDAWIEEWEAPDGDMLIRGTMTLAGDRLTVEANSDIRADRLVETLLRLLPDAEVVVDERQDPPKIRRGGPGRPDDDEPVPPELEEALDEWRRRHEEMWIDESIPALGGLTPRQALDDPSRREDLLALLREEDREGGTGYSASRIRSLLGLA